MNFNLLLLQIPLLLLISKPAKAAPDLSNSKFKNIDASQLTDVTIQVKVTYDEKFKKHVASLGKNGDQFVKDMFVEVNRIVALPGLDIDLRYELHPTISYYGDGVVMIPPNAKQLDYLRYDDRWPVVPDHLETCVDHYLFLTHNKASWNQNFAWVHSSPCYTDEHYYGERTVDFTPQSRASFISDFKDAFQAARILIAQNMITLFRAEYKFVTYDYNGLRDDHQPVTMDGKPCTDIGGVMDYVDKRGVFSDTSPTQWSPCSKKYMNVALKYQLNCYDFTTSKSG